MQTQRAAQARTCTDRSALPLRSRVFGRQHAFKPATGTSAQPVATSLHSGASFRPSQAGRCQSAAPKRMSIVAQASSGSHDLLIVGPGVLGGYAGKLWKQAHPDAHVIGVTNTNNNHDRISKLGVEPKLKSDLAAGKKYPYVLFSAPPSGAADYAAEVSSALALWDSANPQGSFVFTSSMGVCSVEDGGDVTEDCPVVARGSSPSQDRILAAEEQVFKAGGNVLRLVGLYHAQRGAHTYFLRIQQVPRPGDYVVNLIHYEDAADMSVQVLEGAGSGPFRGTLFMGCDNHPVTFRDMINACLESPAFSDKQQVTWGVPDGGANKGKRANNSVSRQKLGGWKPKYDSFESFMKQHQGKDFYTTSGLY